MNKTLQAFDLTNPEHPNLVGELNNSELYRMGMVANKRNVYTLHWWEGIIAVDFKDPTKPKIKDKYHFPLRNFDSRGIIFCSSVAVVSISLKKK